MQGGRPTASRSSCPRSEARRWAGNNLLLSQVGGTHFISPEHLIGAATFCCAFCVHAFCKHTVVAQLINQARAALWAALAAPAGVTWLAFEGRQHFLSERKIQLAAPIQLVSFSCCRVPWRGQTRCLTEHPHRGAQRWARAFKTSWQWRRSARRSSSHELRRRHSLDRPAAALPRRPTRRRCGGLVLVQKHQQLGMAMRGRPILQLHAQPAAWRRGPCHRHQCCARQRHTPTRT